VAKLKNETIEKLRAENKISSIKEDDSYSIFVSTTNRMEKYTREYNKKDKESHLAADQLIIIC
jgi:hypothetical protein